MREVQTAARTLGLEATTLEIQRAQDIVPSFDTLNDRVEALYVCTDPLVLTNRARINTLVMGARLPTIYNSREYVETGGLMSYGPKLAGPMEADRRDDKILRGTKPADIPVEQPTKFDLVINLTTAKVLGFAVPPPLLAIADEVIE
jgi:putative ABC transport system substrate-binding protein